MRSKTAQIQKFINSIESAKVKAVNTELKSENGSVILWDLLKCIVGRLDIVVFQNVCLLSRRARALQVALG